MNNVPQVSIVIATHGDQQWSDLAFSHAYPSADKAARRGIDPDEIKAARRTVDLDEIVVRHSPNATLAEARNIAAAFATKDWLCFLDADDQLDPGFVAAMAQPMWIAEHYYQPALLPSEAGVWAERIPMQLLAPAVSYRHQNGVTTAPAIPNAGRWPDMNECVIGTLIPRLMFRAVGGFRDLPIYEDWDLFLRCVKRGARITHVPAAVYEATVSPGSRNQGPLARETYDRVRAEHAELFS